MPAGQPHPQNCGTNPQAAPLSPLMAGAARKPSSVACVRVCQEATGRAVWTNFIPRNVQPSWPGGSEMVGRSHGMLGPAPVWQRVISSWGVRDYKVIPECELRIRARRDNSIFPIVSSCAAWHLLAGWNGCDWNGEPVLFFSFLQDRHGGFRIHDALISFRVPASGDQP